MAVTKILSIDFDIIMYPCIKMYNPYSLGDANSTELWKRFEEIYNFNEANLYYDAKVLMNIARLIVENVKNGARFIPIESHDSIVKFLKAQTDTYDDPDMKYHIFNIDFHHDVSYSRDSLNMISTFDRYNCTDWLAYLELKDKIIQLDWIKAPNSEMPDPSVQYIIDNVIPIRDIPTLPIDCDEIYFCLSPQWVHPKYYHLFHLITHMVEGFNDTISEMVVLAQDLSHTEPPYVATADDNSTTVEPMKHLISEEEEDTSATEEDANT